MEETVESKEAMPPMQEVHKTPSLGSRSRGSDLASKSSVDSKGRRKKKEIDIPGVHRVTFTVTIAMAVPTVDEEEVQDTKEGKKKRLVDAPRAQNFFHFEYNLFPDDEEPVKTDVVTFGMAAKIYTERQEPKVLKTWVEGEHTWVAWTHCHTVTVTDKLLSKLFTHNLQLRVWDSKEKMSTRAKFDRPKAFRLPQTKPGDDPDCAGGVKTLVMKQVRSYKKLMPKKSFCEHPLPGLDSSRNQSTEDIKTAADQPQGSKDGEPEQLNALLGQKLPHHASGAISTLMTLEKEGDSKKDGKLRSFSRLGKLAGIKEPVEPKEHDCLTKGRKAAPTAARSSKPVISQRKVHERGLGRGRESTISKIDPTPEDVLTDSRSTLDEDSTHGIGKKKGGKLAAKAKGAKKADATPKPVVITQSEILRRDGIICLPIKMSKLFAGMLSLTERLEKPVEGVDDLFLSIMLNGPLMSEEQKIALNPLVVTVHAATNMPDMPLSFSKLRRKCDPVYVKYKLYSDFEHLSATREQDKNLYWDDINVLLAGKVHQAELKERLRGTPLEIEVHDRDRIAVKRSTKAKLFGDELEDEKISNVGAVSSKRTMFNPFTDREKPWNPYGVAKFDLSDLLLGQQLLYITSPILPCPSPDILGMKEGTKKDGKIVGVAGAVDGPVISPLPMGHYIQSNSTLKIKVTLAYPLATPASIAAKIEPEATFECPFSRIVFLFPYKDLRFLHMLHSLITNINSHALDLDDLPMHVIQGALSTYKLSVEQQQSRTLDILTGFQLLDSKIHLFVLEGLQKRAIKLVWESLQPEEGSDVRILYNSEFSFSERLYGPLDVDVCRIKLHEPLSVICKQPLLYIRDMVPKPCFQSLVKLEELCHCPRLRDTVKNDLFPTADMVLSMSREFGVPMTMEDFDELNPEVQDQIADQEAAAAAAASEAARSSRVWVPLDNYNDKFIHQVKRREEAESHLDYEKSNKVLVHRKSQDNSQRRNQKLPVILRIDSTGEVYNYGPQALNSAELAKEQLRQMLSKNPHRRYTYSQRYLHMTIPPDNPDEIRQREVKSSLDRMKTTLGWRFPGKKTMAESNRHPMIPNFSRIMDLQQPWEENAMFANDRPVLDWRRPYDWPYRKEDMDVWSKAPRVFGADEPLSIHLPGELDRQERRAAQQEEFIAWRSKLVVDDTRQYFYRRATELQPCGYKTPDQLAKLKGLLKDPPQKLSLRKGTMALQDIPPLGVVQHPELDPRTRSAETRTHNNDDDEPVVKGFHPGAEIERDWNLPGNQIPMADYHHKAFKEEKGHDFVLYHMNRDLLHKRHIQSMKTKEYDLDLFQWPEALQYLQMYSGPDGTGPYVLPTAAEMEALGFSKRPGLDSGFGTFATTHEDTAPVEAIKAS